MDGKTLKTTKLPHMFFYFGGNSYSVAILHLQTHTKHQRNLVFVHEYPHLFLTLVHHPHIFFRVFHGDPLL